MILRKSIDEVIETARIEEVVGDFVDLKPRGANLIGLCPFHKEKTPSFYVSASKNIFKCFGCGKGGSPIQFLMEAEQLSFPEAIRQSAKKYNIELEETHKPEINLAEDQERESLHIVNQFALDYFQNQLWNTDLGKSVALSYFKQRGFTESTIRKFELGFAPDKQDALFQEALQKSFQLEFLKKLGLVNDHQRDFFRNRVIFPIHHISGKPIAFAGRLLGSDAKVAKYINSPETELYQKSKTLYGLHLAKKSIREKNQCILVEGYTDVISLVQAGIENVVASSGTSLTEEQILAIKRLTNNILILYDGDPAGIKAATRGVDLILQEGLNVKIAIVPNQDDPDGYVQKIGSTAFEKFLKEEAADFILFKLQSNLKTIENDPVQRAVIINEIIRSIAKIADPITRSVYLMETHRLTAIDEASLRSTCNKILDEERSMRAIREKKAALDRDAQILQQIKGDEEKSPNQELSIIGKDEFQERDICRILLLYGHHWYNETDGIPFGAYIIEHIADTLPYFENDNYKKIILEYSQLLSEGQIPEIQYFINHTSPELAELAVDLNFSKYEYSNNWSDKLGIYLHTQNEPDKNFYADINQSILRFKLKKYNRAIAEFESKIKTSQLSEEELEIELKSHQYILQERNYIASLLRTVIIQ